MELNPEILEGQYYLIEGRRGSYVVPASEIGEIPTGDREELLRALSDEEVVEFEEQLDSYTGFDSLTQVQTISLRSGVVGRLVTDWIAGPRNRSSFDTEGQATRYMERLIDYESDVEEDEEEDEEARVAAGRSPSADPGALTEAKLEQDSRAIVIREVVPRQYYTIFYGSIEVAETDSARRALGEAQDFIVASSIKDPRIYSVSKKGIERVD